MRSGYFQAFFHLVCSKKNGLSSVVTEVWPYNPYTFRALRKTFGAMWVRCDVCRRYGHPLSIGGLQDLEHRSKTFSCFQCGCTSQRKPRLAVGYGGLPATTSCR